jgi:hypothetical protein
MVRLELMVYRLTRRGKACQPRCQGQRSYRQSGARSFSRASHNTPAPIYGGVDSCQRSRRVWLHRRRETNAKSAQGTFSASRSSPRETFSWMLTFPTAHLLQRGLVPESVLSWLHDKSKSGCNRLCGLRRFGFFGRGHCRCRRRAMMLDFSFPIPI